ncbi:hypothetical protein [Methylobacterium indicum]|uniref:hypothetical protein n=1 Tax=Methylobacterium indicum TaxID=1775910 RepID=UPI000B1DA76F|nr:hypothetical protein [Methylobacterium indicum]
MDYGFLLSAIPAAAGIASFIFGVFKFFVDYNGSIQKWKENKQSEKAVSNIKFVIFILSIFSASLIISYSMIKSESEKIPKQEKIKQTAREEIYSHKNKIGSEYNKNEEAKIEDNNNPKNACRAFNSDGGFYENLESCVSEFSCAASEYLCTNIALSAGRIVTRDITCPIGLGQSLPLDKRRDISDQLRLRRCYAESYSWLAGLAGPEANNARGAWRAKVCPEAPAVFSDPSFSQLGHLTDGACPR